MNPIEKRNLLMVCNTLEISALTQLVNSNVLTIQELEEANLSNDKIVNLKLSLDKKENEEKSKDKFKDLKERLRTKKIKASEIVRLLKSNEITLEDLEEFKDERVITSRVFKALKYRINNSEFTPFQSIDDLHPMEEGRTDVYFVGVPGSGKSTMLSGILNYAFKNGLSLTDTYHNEGAKFQTKLLQDFGNGVLPAATASGSYNYIATSILGEDEKRHPFNIVDVPGEVFNKIHDNPEVESFLHYIHNTNRKILAFVIDSLAHEDGYSNSTNAYDQAIIYPNILQMFSRAGVLEQVDAIYLIVNKFDAIHDSIYSEDSRSFHELADEYLNDQFKALLVNCIETRKDSKSEFSIKVFPYSIGDVVYETILSRFNEDFSKVLLREIINDSFYVSESKGVNKIFKLNK
jgi:hypothetical protein